ncbi:head-tail connector protein [Halalkalibacter oceani]|uniref:head-tail connector protein n=1 Tax=Halalkalibacter oceani TaxID=1653776 RepID=UPI0033930218
MLELAKIYLRIDGAEDDQTLGFLLDAAKEYLVDAGVKEQPESKTYQLAVLLLVSHWYENRQAVVVGQTSKQLENSLQSLILQLKAGGADEPG